MVRNLTVYLYGMKHKYTICLLAVSIATISCNRQQNDVVTRTKCDYIGNLKLSDYESETGEFNYAEDACELFRSGATILETKKER